MLADAILAEELGVDSLWVAENHFSPDRQCSSPFVIAGVLAGATHRMRIGVFSILTFAHPVRIAEDAATLDVMSGERLMLCFGTGYRPEEFAAFGVAMDGKGARFRECLEVIQKAWTGPFTHQGKHFRFLNKPREHLQRPFQSPSYPARCRPQFPYGWHRSARLA
jgi:alkanesulfonate monooxygenase SsuD/methylene tetrahydromethanopterin reductase-like flavin-dependent oxidoreductase (luciferase family)